MKEKEEIRPEQWNILFGASLYSFAVTKVSCKEDAEDIVQDTFLSAYKAYTQFKNKCSIKTWLISILKNKIVDYYRNKGNIRNNYSSAISDLLFDHDNLLWEKTEIDHCHLSDTTDRQLLESEFYEIFDLCLQELPAKLRYVFIAKYIQDKETEEICKEFNISMSNYWVIIFRSKALLKSYLEKYEIYS